MSALIEGNPWVWVVIVDPGEHEQFLGQHEPDEDVSYIPTFLGKEEAIESLEHLAQEEGHKYEVQAVQYDDLARDAVNNGFMLFILSGSGEILQKIRP